MDDMARESVREGGAICLNGASSSTTAATNNNTCSYNNNNNTCSYNNNNTYNYNHDYNYNYNHHNHDSTRYVSAKIRALFVVRGSIKSIKCPISQFKLTR